MNIFTFIDQNAKFKKDKQAIVYIVFNHLTSYFLKFSVTTSLCLKKGSSAFFAATETRRHAGKTRDPIHCLYSWDFPPKS